MDGEHSGEKEKELKRQLEEAAEGRGLFWRLILAAARLLDSEETTAASEEEAAASEVESAARASEATASAGELLVVGVTPAAVAAGASEEKTAIGGVLMESEEAEAGAENYEQSCGVVAA